MLPKSVFVKYVKDALTHLYDPISLQRHPLGMALVDPGATDQRIRAQKLREIIVEAIEQLQPDSALPFGSKEWVAYRILNHRYLEAMTPPEVAGRKRGSRRRVCQADG
jgi:hypothetical protein